MTSVDDRDPETVEPDDRADDEPAARRTGQLTTVVLAHPDASRRSLFARRLGRDDDIEVVAAVSEAGEAIETTVDLLPDVVAIAAGPDLVPAITRIVTDAPSVAILVLDPDDDGVAALGAGAQGVLPKGGSELTRAVTGAARDETVLPPSWAAGLLAAIDQLDERIRHRLLLSETERQVLERMAEGARAPEIADDNEVTERLVNLHVGYAVAKYQRAVEAQQALEAQEARDSDAEEAPGNGTNEGSLNGLAD